MLDPDSDTVSLEQFLVADAMVLGRKTFPMTTKNVILEELHVGTEAVFTDAGFTEVSRPTLRRAVMRVDF
jgi:hypothetical protein